MSLLSFVVFSNSTHRFHFLQPFAPLLHSLRSLVAPEASDVLTTCRQIFNAGSSEMGRMVQRLDGCLMAANNLKLFEPPENFLQWKQEICGLLLGAIKTLTEDVAPETLHVLNAVFKFIFDFNRDNLYAMDVLECVSGSTLCAHIFAWQSDSVHPTVSQLCDYFLCDNVWAQIGDSIVNLAFTRSCAMNITRRLVLSVRQTSHASLRAVMRTLLAYLAVLKSKWEKSSSHDDAMQYVQLLWPLLESSEVLSSEFAVELIEMVKYFLSDRCERSFNLEMFLLRISGVFFKQTNLKHAEMLSILKETIFQRYLSQTAQSVERDHFKSIDIALRALRLGGIHYTPFLVEICRRVDGPDHPNRDAIDAKLSAISGDFGRQLGVLEGGGGVQKRHDLLEFALGAIFGSSATDGHRHLVLNSVCLPFLLHCPIDTIGKIYLAEYHALNTTNCSLLKYLIHATLHEKKPTTFRAYAFRLLQILYERLTDQQIKDTVVKKVQNFGAMEGSGLHSITTHFLNGKENALTMHVVAASNLVIKNASATSDLKVAAFVCRTHVIARSQPTLQGQSKFIFAKPSNALTWWQSIVDSHAPEKFPIEPWSSAMTNCVNTVISTLDHLWKQNREGLFGSDGWAIFNEEDHTWKRISDSPMPPFMTSLEKFVEDDPFGMVPLSTKMFMLDIVSSRPEYFQMFGTKWQVFVISSLVKYQTESASPLSKGYQSLFLKCTSFLSTWVTGHTKDPLPTDVAYVVRQLPVFFNSWIKILTFHLKAMTKEEKLKALLDVKTLLQYWQPIYENDPTVVHQSSVCPLFDLTIAMDIYIFASCFACDDTQWMRPLLMSIAPDLKSPQSKSARRSDLKAFSLSVFTTVCPHVCWQRGMFTSDTRPTNYRIAEDVFLCNETHGVTAALFDNTVAIRAAASQFVHIVPGIANLVDETFSLSLRKKLENAFKPSNQGATVILLEVLKGLGSHYCSRQFVERLVDGLPALDSASATLVVDILGDVLSNTDETSVINNFLLHLKPSIERLAKDRHEKKGPLQLALMHTFKIWTQKIPVKDWPEESKDWFSANGYFCAAYMHHPDPECRRGFYELCIALDTKAPDTTRPILVHAFADDDDSVRRLVLTFWSRVLPTDSCAERARCLFSQNMVDPTVEHKWSQFATFLMFHLVKVHFLDYQNDAYLDGCKDPLEKVDFHDFDVANTKGDTSSPYMEPMFSTLVASLSEAGKVSQSMDLDAEWSSQSLSQSYNDSTDVNLVMATQDAEDDIFSLTQTDGSQHGSGELRAKRPYYTEKRDGFAVPAVPARFATRKRRARKPLMRKYRVGELPDVQIKFKDLLDPLISLCEVDSTFSHLVAKEIFSQTLTGGCVKEITKTLRDGRRDASFVHTGLGILSALIKRGDGTNVAGIDVKVFAKEAFKTLNFASGIVVVEETLARHDSDIGWDCLDVLYSELGAEEVLQGLSRYNSHEADRLFSVEVDVLQDGEERVDYSRADFASSLLELAKTKKWQGALGLVWNEQEKLLRAYAGMSEFALEARHQVIQRLPLLVSCQDFVMYQLLDESQPTLDKTKTFQLMSDGWKKCGPSPIYDGVDVWRQLYATRTALLSPPITRGSPAAHRALIEGTFQVADGFSRLSYPHEALKYASDGSKLFDKVNLTPTFEDKLHTAKLVFKCLKPKDGALHTVPSGLIAPYESQVREGQYSNNLTAEYFLLKGNIDVANRSLSVDMDQRAMFQTSAIDSFESANSAEGHFACALFLERLLSERVDSASVVMYVERVLDAVRLGSDGATDRFPRVLKQLSGSSKSVTAKACSAFARKSSATPMWKFLRYVPLMFSMLNGDAAVQKALAPILIGLAEEYPQAIYYDYLVARDSLFKPGSTMEASHPLRAIQRLCEGVPGLGEFAKALIDVGEQAKEIKVTASSKLDNKFLKAMTGTDIEIPGQYTNCRSKPLPASHAKISYVSEKVLRLKSLRSPTRICLYGSDGRPYYFLVKGGEDLRNDQRVEQIFHTINTVLHRDQTCGRKQMRVETFAVIPMSTKVGIIEWIDNTVELNSIYGGSSSTMSPLPTALKLPKGKKHDWEFYKKLFENYTTVAGGYANEVDTQFRHGHLAHYVKSSARTCEVFCALRMNLVKSLATLNVAGYLLGIGDRHLGNCLVGTKDLSLIPIDFGHTFGSATFLLPIPELIPFRLDPQMEAIMSPHHPTRAMEAYMAHAFIALKREKTLVLTAMEVYVNDPLLEWRNRAKRVKIAPSGASSQRDGHLLAQEFETLSVSSYGQYLLDMARGKLEYQSPFDLLRKDIQRNQRAEVAKYKSHILAFLDKKKAQCARDRERAATNGDRAECADFVRQLTFLATDREVQLVSYAGLKLWL